MPVPEHYNCGLPYGEVILVERFPFSAARRSAGLSRDWNDLGSFGFGAISSKIRPKKNIMRLRSIAVISSSSTVCTFSLLSDTEPFGGSPRRISNTGVIAVNANKDSVSVIQVRQVYFEPFLVPYRNLHNSIHYHRLAEVLRH